MKNVWKGLIIGASTGAVIGVVLDGLYGGGRIGRELADQGRERLASAHLGARAHDAVADLAEVLQSDVAPAARDALTATSEAVRSDIAPRIDQALSAMQDKATG